MTNKYANNQISMHPYPCGGSVADQNALQPPDGNESTFLQSQTFLIPLLVPVCTHVNAVGSSSNTPIDHILGDDEEFSSTDHHDEIVGYLLGLEDSLSDYRDEIYTRLDKIMKNVEEMIRESEVKMEKKLRHMMKAQETCYNDLKKSIKKMRS